MPKPTHALRVLRTLAIACAAVAAAAGAGAAPITFEGTAHGEIVTDDFADQGLAMINVTNLGGGPDFAVTFDSSLTGTRDDDLEDAWDLGNLPADTFLGNLLIIQETSIGCTAGATAGSPADICDNADDEGSRAAGIIELVFAAPVQTFGLDLVDIDSSNLESGMIVFHDGASSASIMWSDFESGGAFEVTGLVFGDNSLNRIPEVAPGDVGLTQFDRVEIFMGGSGAIDNVVIPEPATAGLLGLGLAALAARSRSRS